MRHPVTPHGTRVVLSPVRSHSVTSVLVPLWLGKGLWGVRVTHQPRGPQTFLFLCASGHLGTWPRPWFHLCLFGLQRIEWVGAEGQESLHGKPDGPGMLRPGEERRDGGQGDMLEREGPGRGVGEREPEGGSHLWSVFPGFLLTAFMFQAGDKTASQSLN